MKIGVVILDISAASFIQDACTGPSRVGIANAAKMSRVPRAPVIAAA